METDREKEGDLNESLESVQRSNVLIELKPTGKEKHEIDFFRASVFFCPFYTVTRDETVSRAVRGAYKYYPEEEGKGHFLNKI